MASGTSTTLSELAKEVASFTIKERNKNHPQEVLFSAALQWFRQSQNDDDCTEEELAALLKDTVMMWGEVEYFKTHSKFLELFRSASVVVEIPNLPDGSYDTKALETLVKAVEASEYNNFVPDDGGFEPVISEHAHWYRRKKTTLVSRVAFNYLPGWWDFFQEVIKTAAREHKIKVLRFLLCPSNHCLRFPADGDYED
jgi:hypothetical protein